MVHTIQPATTQLSKEISGHDLRIFGVFGYPPGTIADILNQGQSFVACVDDELAGYALIDNRSGLPDLVRLAVLDQYRGKGLGRRLLRQTLQANHCCTLTVRKENAAARNLYREHGFQVVGHTEESLMLLRT